MDGFSNTLLKVIVWENARKYTYRYVFVRFSKVNKEKIRMGQIFILFFLCMPRNLLSALV